MNEILDISLQNKGKGDYEYALQLYPFRKDTQGVEILKFIDHINKTKKIRY